MEANETTMIDEVATIDEVVVIDEATTITMVAGAPKEATTTTATATDVTMVVTMVVGVIVERRENTSLLPLPHPLPHLRLLFEATW